MALTKKVFAHYGRYYVRNHGKNLDAITVTNEELKKHILEHRHCLEEKTQKAKNKNIDIKNKDR